MLDSDVFILGGGPAGLAAAIAARAKGLTVTVADAGTPPIGKACGEGLMPDSLAAAASLGLNVTPENGATFRGIRFQSANHSVEADFTAGKGIGLRRPLLHRLLVERAEAAGTRLLWGTPVSGFNTNEIRLGPTTMRSRWIIGADGTQSRLRRWAGVEHYVRKTERFAYRRHYRAAPWSPYMEIHWGRDCQFYVTPVAPDEICVVLMTRRRQQRIADALPLFPALQARLTAASGTTPERGAIAATRQLARVTRNNIALIGDASGMVDPITGQGIRLAFQQASALAEALAAGDLSLYEASHRRICRRARFMSDFMLLLDKSPRLQTRAMRSFEKRPDLFARLLAAHVGHWRTSDFFQVAIELGLQVALA
jgi:flavin-dependent dehydrogenase